MRLFSCCTPFTPTKKLTIEMNEFLNFIRENSGVLILCVALLTLIITLIKLIPKRPKLKVTGYSRYSGLNPTETRRNGNPEDRTLNDETNASREMLTKITLSLRNVSKKRAFNVRIKKLCKEMNVRKTVVKGCSIEPDGEITTELEYKKKIFGKYKNIKNPDFFKDIDVFKDFTKNDSEIEIAYEDSKGKEYYVSHFITKNKK